MAKLESPKKNEQTGGRTTEGSVVSMRGQTWSVPSCDAYHVTSEKSLNLPQAQFSHLSTELVAAPLSWAGKD